MARTRTTAKLIDRERRALATGNWGPWEHGPLPTGARGWLGQVHAVVKNHVVCVLMRTVTMAGIGEVKHLAIRNYSSSDIPWAAKQRIKNELAGCDRMAVEVFPDVADLIDEANMYHLWVLPRGHIRFPLS